VLDAAKQLAIKEGWAGKVQGAFRIGGRILIVVGLAADAYRIYTAQDKVKTTIVAAGGWAGALAVGGAAAEATAPADVAGPPGWIVNGLATLGAGALGYWAGSNATETIYDLIVDGQPITVQA
jgi:hypothetical protein